MIFEKIKSRVVAHLSYFVGSGHEAMVVDPQRDCQVYVMSYAVADLATGGGTVMVFTGDTLFVGDTGRTDFGGPEKRREWSESLYNSIYGKLLPLGDHVVLCPAHGSGSVCGGGIADREVSTLGAERLMNPLLQMTREEFIDHKVKEDHHYTPYFRMMEKYNVEGAPFVGCGPNPKALTAKEFKEKVEAGGVVVDTRPPPSFGAGHIKGSYSISAARLGMGGWVLPYDKPLLLVLGGQDELDYVARSLSRMGYDNIGGYLTGTIASWYLNALPIERFNLITAPDLKEMMEKDENLLVVDVRSLDEYNGGHIDCCKHLYAGLVEQHADEIPKDRPVALICKSGTRSGFASSMLLRMGYTNVYNVLGGMTSWGNAGYPVTK